MTRRLLNLLTVLSLVVAVAVAVAWVRGLFAGDALLYTTGGTSLADQTTWVFGNGGGGVMFIVTRGSGSDVQHPDDGMPLGLHWRTVPPTRYGAGPWWGDSAWNRAGFYFFNETGNSFAGIVDLHGFIVPAWFFMLFALALPAARAVARFRRRRTPGTCTHCGYDLRATSDRCPECGAPAPPSRVRSAGRNDRSGAPDVLGA